MRAGRRLRMAVLIGAVWVLDAPAARAADDQERLQQLQAWAESPLDLREADVAELAMLPGVGPDLAGAIVGLREADALSSVEDLRRIPGLGPVELDVMRPYVRVGRERAVPGAEYGVVAQHRDPDTWQSRELARLVSGRLTVELLRTGRQRQVRRLAASVAPVHSLEFAAGDLAFAGGGGIFAITGSRSRVGPGAMPRAPDLRARTDSGEDAGWRGGAIRHPGLGFVFVGRGPSGGRAVAAAIRAGSESLRLGLALRHEGSTPAVALDLLGRARRTSAWARFTHEGGTRSAAFGVRGSGPRFRLGLDASSTDGGLERGGDPVTGHRLDRAHQVLQVHGRLRGPNWSAGLIGRELRRGDEPAVVPLLQLDLVWRPRKPAAPERLELEVRTVPDRRVNFAAWLRPVGLELRVRFSRSSDARGAAEIYGVDLTRRRPRGRIVLAGAVADGKGSRLWSVQRPGAGVHPVWLRPGELLATAGAEFSGARLRCGFWAWIRGGADRDSDAGLGFSCRIRAGGLVRRLLDEREPDRLPQSGPAGPEPGKPHP